MELEKSGGNAQNLPATMPERNRAIMGTLAVFNQMRAFKLDRAEAEGWMATILRLRPEVDVLQLRMAVDAMIGGKIPYDERIGIRNVIIALDRVVMTEPGKFEIINNVPI
jgi:hypothetical protein